MAENPDDDDTARPLPAEPSWVHYDPDLEQLCRIAASVGSGQPAAAVAPGGLNASISANARADNGTVVAPISYTALVTAFLWGDDPVSKWFRSYADTHQIAIDEI